MTQTENTTERTRPDTVLESEMEPKYCSICHQGLSEYGNNAQPINDGWCCDACNTNTVIPARLRGHPDQLEFSFPEAK